MDMQSEVFKRFKILNAAVLSLAMWLIPHTSYAETSLYCEAENQQYIFCFLGELNSWGKVRRDRSFLISYADKSTKNRSPWGDITYDTSHAGTGTTTPKYLRRKGHLTKSQFYLDIAYGSSDADYQNGKVYRSTEEVKMLFDRTSQTGYVDLRMVTRFGKPPVNIKLNKLQCSFEVAPHFDCRLPSW